MRVSKSLLTHLVLVPALVLLPGFASAQFFDDFESYTAGDDVIGSGGWSIWDVAGPATLVTDSLAFSASQSLALYKNDDLVQPLDDSYVGGQWVFSVQIYVPSSSIPYWKLKLYSSTTIGDPDPQYSTFLIVDRHPLPGGLPPEGVFRSYIWEDDENVPAETALFYDEWVEIRVEIDLDANTQAIFYDDHLLQSGPWQTAGRAGIGSIRMLTDLAIPWDGSWKSVLVDDMRLHRDCNENSIPDNDEIADGSAEDCDGDGRLDECARESLAPLASPTADQDDEFGSSVAMHGDVLVAGAPLHVTEGHGGAIYVYRFVDGEWPWEATLIGSDSDFDDEFGAAVAVSGDWIIAGAQFSDAAAPNGGAVYFFHFDRSTAKWEETQRITNQALAAHDRFGSAVAIDGEFAVAGAFLDDDAGVASGVAYVYQFDAAAGEWVETATLRPETLQEGDQFARSVAISGGAIFLGAPRDDDLALNAGAVYLYEFDGADWNESEKFHASDSVAFDYFGQSLAADCGVLAAGAILVDGTHTENVGAVYVLRRTAMGWAEEAKITHDELAFGSRLGSSVAIAGELLIVGSDPAYDYVPEVAFAYHVDGATWSEVAAFENPAGDEPSGFGAAVATNGALICAGAPHEDNVVGDVVVANSGAVYVSVAFDGNGNGTNDSCDIATSMSADRNGNGLPDECEDGPAGAECTLRKFLRGDCNGNGTVSALSDTQYLLEWRFHSRAAPPCLDAADVDGDDRLSTLVDALVLLQWQYSAGPAPASPGPTICGLDNDADFEIPCAESPNLCE